MNSDDNLKAAELITKSLSGSLSRLEQQELGRYMDELEERDPEQLRALKSFEELSAAITESAIYARDASEDGDGEGLSEVAKERMRRSVRREKFQTLAKTTDSSEQQVAETNTSYFNSSSGRAEECREAVSRFTLIRKIGVGGLGTVWLARDERLRRNVALKELNPSAANDKRMRMRFQREAEITGHLEHPNVVPLYMSGVNPETGLPFYAMRFLGKQTLAEAIQEYHDKCVHRAEKPLDLHRLLSIFLKVCQAIAYAHSRGVIHRDLKPENVILDNFGQVIVLDWGLAKMEEDGRLAMERSISGDLPIEHFGQTLDGDVVGTPLYMSPEQAAGDLSNIDAQTDVYGLGAILYAILSGSAPHENSNLSRDGTLRVKQYLDRIAKSKVRSLRELKAEVPKDLEAICLRALANRKYARHESATALANDVEMWIAGVREKESQYGAMRLAARDLKSRLCVQMRELIALSQFMVELPPIQELINNVDGDRDEFAVWRERLSQILLALIKVKPNISGNGFCRIDGERARELVRVERSLIDPNNTRNVPQSRLGDSIASQFQLTVLDQFPGECAMAFDCTAEGTVRLVCGVPVFDSKTEEPFGIAVTEAEVGNLVRPELAMAQATFESLVVDDNGSVLFSSTANGDAKRDLSPAKIEKWDEIKQALDRDREFLDPNREVYATRLPLPRRQNSMNILFRAS
jgi:serine/threonine protein kinase